MKQFMACITTEWMKLRKSKVFWFTNLVFLFIPGMMALIVWISLHPEVGARLGIVGTKASLFENGNWSDYFEMLNQLVATIGLIGFGFVFSWVFGKEFTDRTFKEYLALPVSRFKLALSRFSISLAWSVLLSVLLFSAGNLFGSLIHLPGWSAQLQEENAIRFFICAAMAFLVSTPVAYITCVGRGLPAPFAFIILSLITAQLLTATGLGPWFPWAVPGIFTVTETMDGMNLIPLSYLLLIITSILGMAATFRWWYKTDHH